MDRGDHRRRVATPRALRSAGADHGPRNVLRALPQSYLNHPVTFAGKPAVLVTVRGGSYMPGTPREGWDHATGWMRRILADVWQLDPKVVESEFTLVGVNPALDQFKDLAYQLRQGAEEQARREGRELGAAVARALAA
jgi:hypothetical protein